MKKVLAVLTLLLLLAAALLPYLGGVKAERAYQRMIAAGDGSPGLELTPVSFERGWLRSTATTRLRLGGGEGAALDLRHTIVHGPLPVGEWLAGRFALKPVLAVVRTQVVADVARRPAIAAALGDTALLSIRTVLHPEGYGEAQILSPPIRKDKDWSDFGVDWQGLDGTVLFLQDRSQASGNLRAPRLELASNESVVRLRDMALEFDVESGEDGLPSGHWSLRAGGVEWSSPGEEDPAPVFALGALRYDQAAVREGELFHVIFSLALDGVRTAAQRYGPGELRLAVRNLHAESLARYRAQSRELADGPAEARAKLQAQLLPPILAHAPELALERLRLAGEAGDLEVSGRLGLREEGAGMIAMSPLLALAAADGHLQASVPEDMMHGAVDAAMGRALDAAAAVENAGAAPDAASDGAEAAAEAERMLRVVAARAAWLEKLVDGGVLRRADGAYRMRLELAEGAARLNGEPVDPALLLGGAQTTASARPHVGPPGLPW